jgi:hypothetical protein
MPTELGYEILEVILNECPWLYHLILKKFDFGDDPDLITLAIKEGFKRITQLELLHSAGKVRMFVENTELPNLSTLKYLSLREPGKDRKIIAAIALKYHTITSLNMSARFLTTGPLKKVVEFCQSLESLTYRICMLLLMLTI